MRNPGTVTDEIVSSIKKLSKTNFTDIRKEIQILEPTFDKWAKNSIKDEIQSIKVAGVTIHSEEAAITMGATLLQAKYEGFLMGIMSQDREWDDKLFMDRSNSQEEVPYNNAVMALLHGKLDRRIYVKLEKKLTDDERNDPTNWKVKAIQNFKDNNKIKEQADKVREHMLKERRESQRKRDDNDRDDLPDVGLTT